MNNRKYYDYTQVQGFCETLASRLKNGNFDSVVGVSRGGLIPATIIAECMNVRELRTMGVRSYQLNGIGKRKDSVLYQSCSPYLVGNVLLIDDMSESLNTLSGAAKLLKSKGAKHSR